MARNVASSKLGSWLGLTAFNHTAKQPAIADGKGKSCNPCLLAQKLEAKQVLGQGRG